MPDDYNPPTDEVIDLTSLLRVRIVWPELLKKELTRHEDLRL